MKVGYPYFVISGVLFIMAAVYLYMSNDEIPALEENHIPSRSISFVIAIWGIFRLYKAYTVYSKNRNDEN